MPMGIIALVKVYMQHEWEYVCSSFKSALYHDVGSIDWISDINICKCGSKTELLTVRFNIPFPLTNAANVFANI